MIRLPPGFHGAYLRSELCAELGERTVKAAIRDGYLSICNRKVLVSRNNALELHTRAATALLIAGQDAVLSRHTAALLHGYSAADQAPINVLVPYSRRLDRLPWLAVHHGVYSDNDITETSGLRVLKPGVVIAELLCWASRSTALACTDQALSALPSEKRTKFIERIAEKIRERHDPRGTKRARFLLDLATGLPESPAESWLLLRLVDAGFPLPVLQYAVTNLDGHVIYRLDFGWPEFKVGLEYDGYEAHADHQRRDALRDADLARRGWLIVRAEAKDLRDSTTLLIRLRSSLRERGYIF